MIIAEPLKYAPFEWLDHVQREGLVFARPILEDLGISPVQQTRFDSQEVAAHLATTRDEPAVADPLGFLQSALGWPVSRLAALRANKSETIEWLKFTLEGVGERTHGYAFEDTAF